MQCDTHLPPSACCSTSAEFSVSGNTDKAVVKAVIVFRIQFPRGLQLCHYKERKTKMKREKIPEVGKTAFQAEKDMECLYLKP